MPQNAQQRFGDVERGDGTWERTPGPVQAGAEIAATWTDRSPSAWIVVSAEP